MHTHTRRVCRNDVGQIVERDEHRNVFLLEDNAGLVVKDRQIRGVVGNVETAGRHVRPSLILR